MMSTHRRHALRRLAAANTTRPVTRTPATFAYQQRLYSAAANGQKKQDQQEDPSSSAYHNAKDAFSSSRGFLRSMFRSPFAKEVTEGLKDTQKTILDASSYGGITTKAYRDQIRRRRMGGASATASDSDAPMTAENPNAGANVVLHKDSKWKEAWSGFKEKNPIVQGIFSMRRRYEESDNVLVNTGRLLADRIRDIFGPVFEETEHAVAIAEIKHMDPSFDLEGFLKDTREFMIPEVLEAYVQWNPKELKSWCSDGVYSVLEASRAPLAEQGQTVEGRLLDLRNVELVMAKMMDDTPLLILSFKTQQTEVIRDRAGELVAGSDDEVNDVFYIWALTKDAETFNPLTQGWKIVEFAIQHVRQSY